MEKLIKIILAFVFFLCLLDMPYGYYQLVRLVSLVGFSILALQSFENNQKEIAFIYIGLALLFQPFIKINLGRDLWNIVDVIVGVGLVMSLVIKKDKENG